MQVSLISNQASIDEIVKRYKMGEKRIVMMNDITTTRLYGLEYFQRILKNNKGLIANIIFIFDTGNDLTLCLEALHLNFRYIIYNVVGATQDKVNDIASKKGLSIISDISALSLEIVM